MDRLEYAMRLCEKIEALDVPEDDKPAVLDMLLALPEGDSTGMMEAYDRVSAAGKECAKKVMLEIVNRLEQRRMK